MLPGMSELMEIQLSIKVKVDSNDYHWRLEHNWSCPNVIALVGDTMELDH